MIKLKNLQLHMPVLLCGQHFFIANQALNSYEWIPLNRIENQLDKLSGRKYIYTTLFNNHNILIKPEYRYFRTSIRILAFCLTLLRYFKELL